MKRLLAAFVSTLALAGAAHAADVTYPMLNNQTTVQDTDLLAVWRASGPLAKVNASVLEAYIQGKLTGVFPLVSNNLSEFTATAATARTNLGLGTAATQNTGTSGANVCLMNANCAWSGTETFNAAPVISTGTAASSTDYLIMRPTDLAVGKPELFFHKNASALIWELDSFDGTSNQTATLNVNLTAVAFAGTASAASFSGPLTGNASTASKWQTTRTETLSGDVTGSASVDGSANWTVSATLATVNSGPGSCGDSSHVCQVTTNGKGLVTSQAAVAIASQQPAMSASTTGALETNNGSAVSWASRASLYITSCSNFGCTTSGATNASFSRIGVGHYTVTFTNAFPNTNFSFLCVVGQSTVGNWFCQEDTGTGRSTTSVSFYVTNNNSTAQDNAGSIDILVLAN